MGRIWKTISNEKTTQVQQSNFNLPRLFFTSSTKNKNTKSIEKYKILWWQNERSKLNYTLPNGQRLRNEETLTGTEINITWDNPYRKLQIPNPTASHETEEANKVKSNERERMRKGYLDRGEAKGVCWGVELKMWVYIILPEYLFSHWENGRWS